jgi:2-amino-4-hydroxy-6-hydroxymethyldihydropteridine diphosphokinase
MTTITTMATVTAYLALGSNLGDRLAFIEGALARLAAAGVALLARSPTYETDAVAAEAQPPYLNAVVRVATSLPAGQLLALGLAIEGALGRARPPGRLQAARTIDIDLLLYADQVIDGAAAGPGGERRLTVPHPALLARPFVRIPLADVAAPGLRHPITGDRLDRAAPSPGVRRLAGGRPVG